MPGFPGNKKAVKMLSYQPGRLKNEALVFGHHFQLFKKSWGIVYTKSPIKIYESDVFWADQTDRGGPSKKAHPFFFGLQETTTINILYGVNNILYFLSHVFLVGKCIFPIFSWLVMVFPELRQVGRILRIPKS